MSQQGNFSLSTKDVIHIENFQGKGALLQNDATLRIHTLLRQLETILKQSGALSIDEIMALLQQGIPCEVLQPGAPDWQSGTLQLSLQFHPSAAPMATSMEVQQVAASVAPAVQPVASVPESVDPSPLQASDSLSMMDNSAISVPEITESAIDAMAFDVPEMADELTDESTFDAALLEDEASSIEAAFAGSDLDENDLSAGLDAEIGSEFDGLMNDEMDADPAVSAGMMGDVDSELDEFAFMNAEASSTDNVEVDVDVDVEMAFDLDSQAVDVGSVNDLDSPWDLNNELDAMLLQNGNS
ncbi:KGK domain-containing protein [Alkalinema pantanalense CENA528]|uniref:KGK domain-containing protein n=1 Tax=Alkalinema pantanalense TaxID=1620705 RepID=UPI003D6F78F2